MFGSWTPSAALAGEPSAVRFGRRRACAWVGGKMKSSSSDPLWRVKIRAKYPFA